MRMTGDARRAVRALVTSHVLFSALGAGACSVPVFRYALERWERDPYPVAIVHRGEAPALPADVKAYLGRLQDRGAIWLDTVDVGTASRVTSNLLAQVGDVPLPALTVLLPPRGFAYQALTVLPWEDVVLETLEPVFESETRKILADRIVEGHTAVWVFLEWDDADRNREALAKLEAALRVVEEELQIPRQEDVTGESGEQISRLQIKFSTLSLPYDLSDRPGERIFRDMLLRVEPDLLELEGPMAFPLFGQGRALFALVNKGITAENVADACAFLVGPCSCQVKAMNPGMDILLSVDWWEKVESLIQLNEDLPPPLIGYSEIIEQAATNGNAAHEPQATGSVEVAGAAQEPLLHPAAEAGTGADRPSFVLPIALAIGAFVLLAAVGSLLVRLKR